MRKLALLLPIFTVLPWACSDSGPSTSEGGAGEAGAPSAGSPGGAAGSPEAGGSAGADQGGTDSGGAGGLPSQAGTSGQGGSSGEEAVSGAGGAGGAGGVGTSGAGGSGGDGAIPTVCPERVDYVLAPIQEYLDETLFTCAASGSCVYNPKLPLTYSCANPDMTSVGPACDVVIRTVSSHATLDTRAGLLTVTTSYTSLTSDYIPTRTCVGPAAVTDPPEVFTMEAFLEPISTGICPSYAFASKGSIVGRNASTDVGGDMVLKLQIPYCTSVTTPTAFWEFTYRVVEPAP